MDIHIGLGVEVLDFVNSRLQFSVFEDGRGIAGRCGGHSRTSLATQRTLVIRVNI